MQETRYIVGECWHSWHPYKRFWVCEPGKLAVDHFRTRSGAEHAAHLLTRGVASVNPHAIVGCKVVAS